MEALAPTDCVNPVFSYCDVRLYISIGLTTPHLRP
jgi:hypothetical protein